MISFILYNKISILLLRYVYNTNYIYLFLCFLYFLHGVKKFFNCFLVFLGVQTFSKLMECLLQICLDCSADLNKIVYNYFSLKGTLLPPRGSFFSKSNTKKCIPVLEALQISAWLILWIQIQFQPLSVSETYRHYKNNLIATTSYIQLNKIKTSQINNLHVIKNISRMNAWINITKGCDYWIKMNLLFYAAIRLNLKSYRTISLFLYNLEWNENFNSNELKAKIS